MNLFTPDACLPEPLLTGLRGRDALFGAGTVPSWSLVCEDCLTLLESMPAESVDLIATDPAYSGMNEHMKFGHGRIVGHYGTPGNDRWMREFRDSPEGFRRFLELCARVLKPDRHIYVMFDSFSLLSLGHLMREFFSVKNIITWDKVALGMGHYYRRRHEFVIFASKGRRPLAHRAFPDVWQLGRVHRPAYPTQKPRELFEVMVAASTVQGELVLDPFSGAASCGVAALRLARGFVGCDLEARARELGARRLAEMQASGEDLLQARSHLPKGAKAFWLK